MSSKRCPPRCTCGKHRAGPKVAAALRGRQLPAEHREAIARGMSGYAPTDEHRARLADAKRGDLNPMKRPEVAARAQRSQASVITVPTTDLEAEAARRGIRVPKDGTFRTYGLVREEWLALLAAQDWKCAVCDRAAGGALLLNTDHEHVAGWKKLPPEERKRFVRGVLCARCNWRIVMDPTPPAVYVARLADYLAAYEARRDA